MKAIAIVILVISLIFFGSYISANFLTSSSNDVIISLNSLEKIVRDGKWDNTNNGISSVNNKWKQIKNKWAVLLDHQEIDNIEISLSKMNEYVKARALSQSLAEISSLKLLIGHIPEKEALSLGNVF